MTFDKEWTPTPDGMLDIFVDWYNKKIADYDVPSISKEEAYVVWFCYTVGNAKALVSTTRQDHMYYELTYKLSYDAVFVDQYVKIVHTALEREE